MTEQVPPAGTPDLAPKDGTGSGERARGRRAPKTAAESADVLVVGAASVASSSASDAYVMRQILGFKYRVVTGYTSGADIDLAMQRGETQGRANIAWYGIKTRNAEWLREGKISLLYQMGLKRHPDIPADVPLSLDLTAMARSFTAIYQLLPVYPCVETNGGLVRVAEADIPNIDRSRAEAARAFHEEIRLAVEQHEQDDEYFRKLSTAWSEALRAAVAKMEEFRV